MTRALRINPRDPYGFLTFANLAFANNAARQYRQALEWAYMALNAEPKYMWAYIYKTVAYVGLKDIETAAESLGLARLIAPGYVEQRVHGHAAMPPGPLRDRLDTFLRIAAKVEDAAAADHFR